MKKNLQEFSKQYLEKLTINFAGLNLTRILDPEEFYEKQILDSVLPLEQSDLFKKKIEQYKLVVDIGFGGGFPLLPLAHCSPDTFFIGIESKDKKVRAVNQIASEFLLSNVKAVHQRIENIIIDLPCVITFKAVGTVSDFLSKIQIASKEVVVCFYKGPSFEEKEYSLFKETLSDRWELVSNELLCIPGANERRLVSFRPITVPRGTFKNLVKLSHYL